MEMEAYRRIHCYHFLIKPFKVSKLEEILKEVLIDYIKKSTTQKTELIIEMNRVKQVINLNDLVYVEYENRRIVLCLKDSRLIYKHIPLKKNL